MSQFIVSQLSICTYQTFSSLCIGIIRFFKVCLASSSSLFTCDILFAADLVSVLLVTVPLEVVDADLDRVLVQNFLVLVEARLCKHVAALFVLK
jgi:hypothetical protein